MLKWMTGVLMGWCLVAAPVAFADTGVAEDTGSIEDTGSADEDPDSEHDTGTHDTSTDDTGTDDTGTDDSASESTSSSGPTYGAAELAGESGNCATVAAAPAGWMLGCVLLVLVRRRLS